MLRLLPGSCAAPRPARSVGAARAAARRGVQGHRLCCRAASGAGGARMTIKELKARLVAAVRAARLSLVRGRGSTHVNKRLPCAPLALRA
jgi:hypothetical protein